MANFVHLHVHSHYSLLDGLGKIDELIARAKELDMPALALTDHGNMYGAIEFYTKCRKAGIKPIIGVEAYLAPRGMLDKVPKVDSVAYHQLLLAKNETGYRNLLSLVSEAHCRGMYYKPRIDLKLLAQHAKGLIGTSGCLAGMIPTAIVAGDMERAVALARQFAEMFEGDFYLELQHHPSLRDQATVNDALRDIARTLNLPLIATGDVHYVRPEDRETHEVLLAINTGKDLAADDRLTFGTVNVAMEDADYYRHAFADTPEAIANTIKVAEACSLKLKLGENILPNFRVPAGYNEDSYLERLCHDGLKKRFHEITPEITARLNYELTTIKNMGFAAYHLIVADFVTWAKDHGIYVGPGRGSAAGSLVAYATGITDIDPFPYGFLFERYLNPDRIEMPDIDMDFADDRRDEVIDYVRQKYGDDHVAGVATFGTMMGRAAVRDVGRVLGMAYSEVDAIAKLIPPPVQGRHIPLKDSVERVAELAAKYAAEPRIKRLIDFAVKLEGTVRHASQHACAFVICREPTVHYAPVQPAQRGRVGVVTQYSMKPIAELGLLKMDFLGLSNLTIMRQAMRIIRQTGQRDFDIHQVPLDDPKTYRLLARGETVGVFQLESDGMQRYIKELKPDRFEDIIAMVSLYRPGPMQNIPSFIARKHGREPVTYLHPKLEHALAETYGIPVYQEQVMQAAKDLAGFTGGEADTLRKAMGKKIAGLMAQMKVKFIAGCRKHSAIEAGLAETIFKQFEDFAAYGFNKSHAGCYALIAYQTAYLKTNYPAAFLAALLTSNNDNLDKMGVEMAEAARLGIPVLPPDVNESFPEFGVIVKQTAVGQSPANDYIRFGLAAIKNVGGSVANSIVAERQANGPYATLTDFLARLGPTVLNKRVLEALAMSGALDKFGERNNLVQSVEIMTRFLANGKRDASQIGLFAAESVAIVKNIALAEAPPASQRTYLEWEKQLLGIYLTGHPLKEIQPILPHIATAITQIAVRHSGEARRVGGLVTDTRVITTKGNEAMAFVKIEDGGGAIELVIFPRVWSEVKAFVAPERYVIADGRVDTRDGAPKIIVSRVMELHPQESVAAIKAALGPIPQAEARPSRKSTESRAASRAATANQDSQLRLKLPQNMGKKALEEVRHILYAHAGAVPVFVEANHGGTLTLAKTKTSVRPSRDLLQQLEQAGVEAALTGAVMPPEVPDDIVIEDFVEPVEDAEEVVAA